LSTSRQLTLIALALLASADAAAQSADSPALPARLDLKRPDVVAFVHEVSAQDGIKPRELRKLLKEAQPQSKIIEIMTRPIEKVAPWYEYHDRFVTPERISDGVQFWNEHRESLEHIATQFQVPPEYIVAILGVETHYGRNTGGFRALDALATLAFYYPPREKFFRSELAEFLVLARENKFDPLAVKGSYAGALGVPQFMPSQYRRYAVDEDTNQRRDLWADWDDILASVANYLREHGWTPGGPVLAEVRLDPDPNFQIEPHNLKLNETVDSLAARGVKIEVQLPADTPALLISAEQRDGPAYRVGFHNFWVITQYNASARYAMAVYDLAQALQQRVHATTAAAAP
jgi:membrane-bound lytic murein transglycosylase B